MNDNSISKEVVDAFHAAINGCGSPRRITKQRLIDANLAMRKIREYMEDYPNATTRLAACRACLSILGDKQQVPTIDPESLRPHGQWLGKIVLVNGIMSQECSNCHRIRPIDDFCAACGAKMDEEV